MAKFVPYPKYKDSGIEWIGDVPDGWATNRVYSLFAETNLRGGSKDLLLTVTQKEGVLPQSQYQEKTGRRLSQQQSEDYSNYKKVQQNDLIYNKMRMWQGAIGTTNFNGCVSPAYVTMRSKIEIIPKYWENLFKTPNFLAEVNRYSQGICDDQNSCTFDNFREILIVIPSLSEQQAIATFLDRETTHIDTLISKKNRLIELLKEKRQATITQAVTKGLDANAKMKDSGIEWIGEIPKGWGINKLYTLCNKIGSGKTPSGGTKVYVDTGVLFIRSQNVYNEGLRLEEVSYITKEVDEEMSNSRVLPGDILFNVTGGSIGRTCIVPEYFQSANVNQHVCIIRVKNKNFKQFIALYMKSFITQCYVDFLQTGAGREGLNFEQIGNFRSPLPPLHEQQAIAAYLDTQCAKLDTLIAKTEQSIALLKEKRSALITAAVTGKIDVREAVC